MACPLDSQSENLLLENAERRHCYEANTEFSSYDFLVHTLNTRVLNELADHDFYLWRSYAGQLILIDLPSRKLMSPERHENIGN